MRKSLTSDTALSDALTKIEERDEELSRLGREKAQLEEDLVAQKDLAASAIADAEEAQALSAQLETKAAELTECVERLRDELASSKAELA